MVNKSCKFDMLVDGFLLSLANSNTRANFRSDFRSVGEWFQPWDGQEGNLELLKYIRYIEARGLAPRSVRERMIRLNKFYGWLIKFKWRKDNPVDLGVLPRVRDRREPKCPELSELLKLLKTLKVSPQPELRNSCCMALLYFQALRSCEVVALRRCDVEQVEGKLRIMIHGKGNHLSHQACFPQTEKLLRIYLKKTKFIKQTQPLFYNDKFPLRHLSTRMLRFIVDKHLNLAGIKKDGQSCHSLRTAHASLLNAHGFPLTTIQRSLRHQHLESTFAYLRHLPATVAAVKPKVHEVFPSLNSR